MARPRQGELRTPRRDSAGLWRIDVGGKRYRLSGARSEVEAVAWAVGLQRRHQQLASQWAFIRARLENPPNVEALEAAEGEFTLRRLIHVWRSHVSETLGVRDAAKPQLIDLDRLAAVERAWVARSEQIARQRAAALGEFAPPTLPEAVEQVIALLAHGPPGDEERRVLPELLAAIDSAAPDLMDSHLRRSGRGGVSLTRERPTVRETMRRFLADQRARIGLSDAAITADTFNATSKHLRHGLGLSAGRTAEGADEAPLTNGPPPLNLDGDVHALGPRELKALVRHWMDGSRKRRTAVNRLRAVAAMLDWASVNERIQYQWQLGSRSLFKFTSRRGEARRRARIDPYHGPTLAKLMGAATARTRLYILLALNAAMYPRDIAVMAPGDLRVMDGRTYVVRLRSKEASSDEVYETAHALWPETAALLERQRSSANAWGRLLLTRWGTPLEVSEADQWTSNPISKSFYRAVKRADLKGDPRRPQLRQLRKMASSAMHRFADEKVAHMYRGAAFEGSANLYITVDDWMPLTGALDEWARQLRADGVLY